MSCYVVTFEPGGTTTVQTMHERLRGLGVYCPIHSYCWAVITELTAVQVRDYLSQGNLGSRIFVVRSGTEAAWINPYGDKNSEWLKKNL
jgi:hypothetical protein